PNSCLIVVNDGSKDGTGAILDQLASADSRLRIIHKANSGHGPSLIRALNEADSEYVFLVDSDRQIPLDCFPGFWQQMLKPGTDGVFGIRTRRQDPLVRLWLSKFISFTLGAIFSVKLVDPNIPCKLFRREIWTQLHERMKDDTLMAPSLVIAIFAKRHNYNIVEKPVSHRARSLGEPSLRLTKLIKFCFRAFRQLMDVKEKVG
ncbi:MAG TPA: glycosyltransferase family 2 protein, partial [Candidatus Obscuribacterales bacterium]